MECKQNPDAAYDYQTIYRHVSELLIDKKDDYPYLSRWAQPIRYAVLIFDNDAELTTLFHKRMAEVAYYTGLDIAPRATEKETNAVFIITNDLQKVGNSPFVRSLYREAFKYSEGEIDQAILVFNKSNGGNVIELGLGKDGVMAFYLDIVQPSNTQNDHVEAIFIEQAFNALLDARASSNIIQPSITNKKGFEHRIDQLTAFDKALLGAVYDPSIPQTMDRYKAIERISCLIHQRL
jgi:hypothetical protein